MARSGYLPLPRRALIACPSNTYSLAGAATCTNCLANSASTGGASACACNVGYYSSNGLSTTQACTSTRTEMLRPSIALILVRVGCSRLGDGSAPESVFWVLCSLPD